MKKGVNLIGYARAEFGLGEACRLAAKALESAGVPFCIINFPYSPSRQNDLTWKHKEVPAPLYNTNIFFINADQMYYYYKKNILKRAWFRNRYNIGYWHWELPNFPVFWNVSFNLVNEIWVPSQFTFQSISKNTYKPVVIMPHGIFVENPSNMNRKYFGLPESRFLFLNMYDTQSTSARKNPNGVIDAFKKAFKKNDGQVGLVLKVNNSAHFSKELAKLKYKIAEYENIRVIDNILSRQELNGLMNVMDSYVSLHRSEGFGLPIAEAMSLGKPVIATNWSGNVDFINENNACLVDFTIEKIEKNYGPYLANQEWAEPNIFHAANYMTKLVHDRGYANRIGLNAQKTIKSDFSPISIGMKYKSRLTELGLI
ncbi:glycosyltransferase family 4 protein [Cytobacillus massiliigabonensis]|uniref:glycosyltransferase family 4 protein n=1 Tax=Cytobacillus massiliigabonensis TaxID=1871011 RepID=UPI000C82BF45|nr:glycosyltransferase family 4 protein [Cytobacillus massiliigabonensis]